MRYFAVALIVALAGVGVALPGPDQPAPLPGVGSEEPAVSVCPVQEGSGRSTDVAVLSNVDGPTQLTLFAGGGAVGSLGTETGASGSTLIPVRDVAAVGTVGGLVELPTAASASGVVVTGSESLMAEACASVPAPQVFLTGGSSVSGETFSIQLMNPYAGEAIATLQVVSEAGVESNERFNAVVVPPRSSRTIDFNGLIPGRENISVDIQTVLGRVIAVGQQSTGGDSSIWNAVSGAQDWFLPVPGSDSSSRVLVLATPSTVEVDYQIDFYGPEGLEEALVTGVLDARGRAEFDLDEISEETSGVRVISTGPVVPTLRMVSDGEISMTTGSAIQSNRWMLPGAAVPPGGSATAVIFNASIEDSTVSVRPLREASLVREYLAPSDAVLEVGLEAADGYLIESTSPVVVLWTARAATGSSLAMGVPLDDG